MTIPNAVLVRGRPSARELAAVLAVLTTRPRLTQAPARTSNWNRKSLLMRAPISVGPGEWKRSALPR
jgi:hypothetical protein